MSSSLSPSPSDRSSESMSVKVVMMRCAGGWLVGRRWRLNSVEVRKEKEQNLMKMTNCRNFKPHSKTEQGAATIGEATALDEAGDRLSTVAGSGIEQDWGNKDLGPCLKVHLAARGTRETGKLKRKSGYEALSQMQKSEEMKSRECSRFPERLV